MRAFDPIDAHVGARMRARRIAQGITQSALGDAADVSFQQIQKYERGTNRVAASTLWRLGRALGVGPEFFFEGLALDGERKDA